MKYVNHCCFEDIERYGSLLRKEVARVCHMTGAELWGLMLDLSRPGNKRPGYEKLDGVWLPKYTGNNHNSFTSVVQFHSSWVI
jgi:hypothetical protein